eukprot:UN01042
MSRNFKIEYSSSEEKSLKDTGFFSIVSQNKYFREKTNHGQAELGLNEEQENILKYISYF